MTKLLRYPARAGALRAQCGLLDELEIEYIEPVWGELASLAPRWSLSAYDAAYLQLALAFAAPLVTLDARLAAAYDHATALR